MYGWRGGGVRACVLVKWWAYDGTEPFKRLRRLRGAALRCLLRLR